MKFESGFSVAAGAGLRVTIEVQNEVSLLCAGPTILTPDMTVNRFTVNYARNKKNRVATYITTDGTGYSLSCNQVIIESHTQYTEKEDGSRGNIDDTIAQYREGAPRLLEYLRELKKKRDAERAAQNNL